MATVRKKHTAEFKAKVALEAIRQQKTANELTTEYGIHATQITAWKKQALAAIPVSFSGKEKALAETAALLVLRKAAASGNRLHAVGFRIRRVGKSGVPQNLRT